MMSSSKKTRTTWANLGHLLNFYSMSLLLIFFLCDVEVGAFCFYDNMTCSVLGGASSLLLIIGGCRYI